MRKYILTGSIAVIPLFLVYFVVRFLYLFVDQNVMDIIDDFIHMRIPGLGFIITILLLYAIGQLSHNVSGKWLFNSFERITQKIPIIGTTYHVGRQISNTLSLPEKQVFKKVVLVNYLKEDIYTIGFITGSLSVENSKEKLYKIYIPTPPNPTSGTIVITKESEIIDPGWSIDEGFRMVISAGIIGPETLRLK